MYRSDKQLDSVTDDTRFQPTKQGSGGWNLLRRITIGQPGSQLLDFYRQAENMAKIHGHFAEVTALTDNQTHWKVKGPLGTSFEWDSELTEEVAGQRLAWRSLEGASVPNHGWVEVDPAPQDWGTVFTLFVRYDPPAGPLGDAVAALATAVPKIVSDKSLRRLKSLIETGEIATTAGQSSARRSA